VEDLRRGLVTTYRDDARPAPAEVTRLEPAIALALGPGEAPHPRLAPGGTAVWRGYLSVLRGGPYRFQVRLRGRLRLSVAGKEVFAADARGEQPEMKESPEIRLDPGAWPLVAEFTRLPGAARVELLWQAPFFRREPVPFDHLGHLPTEAGPRVAADALAERGRLLAEELNCARCHRPGEADRVAKGLAYRPWPDLSQVGRRVHAGWLYAWLGSPRKLRPAAVMPELFASDEAGDVERYAVTRYLVSLGGPVPPAEPITHPDQYRASVARGRKLYNSVGCIACHGPEAAKAGDKPPEGAPFYGLLAGGEARAVYPLPNVANKTTPERLAEYLANPLAVDPSGRMPGLVLQQHEAQELARFLCQPNADEPALPLPAEPGVGRRLAALRRAGAEEALTKRPAAEQWVELGRRLAEAKGCANCHTLAPGGKPLAAAASTPLADIRKPEAQQRGCLADGGAPRGKAPRFYADARDRDALRVVLREGLDGAGTPAPAHAARAAVARFNCLACHARDGEGGLSPELTEVLRRFENAENAEAVVPPTLTGVAHKLRAPAMRAVLTAAARARPWMGLRMPQFGEPNVGRLPEAFAAAEGTEADDAVHKVPLSAAKIEAGRLLVGKAAFGCVSCHDIAGVPNTGTRGPDLAATAQRVRYDWYLRWLEQPQRMQPGTRMPSVFAEGRSTFDKVYDGQADPQAEAMWAYLSLGSALPLPDGMEPAKGGKGIPLAVKDRPLLLRTFMPGAGSRALAVGFPGGVSVAFDAHACRLAYAWSGSFLDAAPAWADRGGAPARVLGTRFWEAPPGCPVGASPSVEPPDFAARAKDPAYGGPVPEGVLPDRPARLRFAGYSVDQKGLPTFRYALDAGSGEAVEAEERAEPLHSPAGVGLTRRFRLHVPARQTAWLLAGETGREPRLLDPAGEPVALDLKSGRVEFPAAGRLLVLHQEGERVAVLAAAAAPPGSGWRLQRVGRNWQVLLRLPPADEACRAEVELHVWSPYRDDPALLRELVKAR
jgi:cytochrome c553